MANIELDGANKKIKVDSGDLTLDVPGDIILDADGADLVFADGGTDIGAALADADLFIVDDGAGGTNRKVAASRIITYVDANAGFASKGFATAMAIAL